MDIFNTGNSTGAFRLTGSIAAAVCLVVTTSILLLLIFHKAYTSTLQRLLLYLMIFSVIQEACLTVGYATQFEYSGHESFCNMINIVWQWSDTVAYVLTFCIIVFLSYKVCKQLKGNPVPRLSRSKCFRVALECFFIFVVLVLPFAYILPLLPFANCSSFTFPQFCKMNMTVEKLIKCTHEGKTMISIIAGVVPGIVSFVDLIGMFVIAIVLSIVFCCLAREYRETRAALCRTLILLGFFVAVTTIPMVVGIGYLIFFEVKKFNDTSEMNAYRNTLGTVELVGAVEFSVYQLIFPLGFLFYLHSFNLCRWRGLKRAAAEWRCFRICCQRQNEPRVHERATAPASHRVPQPSTTFFDTPYTGAFTDITTEDQQALLPDGGGDTGYGTVINS